MNKDSETKVYKSHSCCWEQGKDPACGQSLESHKQCCLCPATPPETSSWEEEFDKIFELEAQGCSECGGYELVDNRETRYPKGKYHCEYNLEKIKGFISRIASSEYKRGVEDRKKEIIELIKVRALDCPMRSLIINLISIYD